MRFNSPRRSGPPLRRADEFILTRCSFGQRVGIGADAGHRPELTRSGRCFRHTVGGSNPLHHPAIDDSGFCPREDGWARLSSHRHPSLNERTPLDCSRRGGLPLRRAPANTHRPFPNDRTFLDQPVRGRVSISPAGAVRLLRLGGPRQALHRGPIAVSATRRAREQDRTR